MANNNHPKNKAAAVQKRAAVAQRRQAVMANLLGGMNYIEIARALGVSPGTVSGDVKAVLKEWGAGAVEDVQEFIILQIRRYDTLLNTHWGKAIGGDERATYLVLEIMERLEAKVGKYVQIAADTQAARVQGEILGTNPGEIKIRTISVHLHPEGTPPSESDTPAGS